MLELFELLLGIGVLISGIFIGDFLAKKTKEELKFGRIYFRVLVLIGLIGGIIGLIIRDDFILFGFFFIAIIVSRSLR